jgi:hypothetical protein
LSDLFAGYVIPSFFPLLLTIRFLLPLSLTPGACAPNHNHVFPFHIPSLSHR